MSHPGSRYSDEHRVLSLFGEVWRFKNERRNLKVSDIIRVEIITKF
jgi:hypothetical protein